MFQDKMVLCASSAYEKKFYLNENFEGLPQHVKDELKIMCVLFTEDVGGVLSLEFDENGNLAGAVGFHSSSAERYAEYGYSEAFAHFATGHVKYFDWDNYHFVDGDSSNCKSVYSVSYHGISSAAWIDGWGFHPFYCPTAVSCCVTGNPVSVAVELSNTYEDSASLSKRVAESIRFE